MPKPLISFRIDTELYLKIEALAAEEGLSPSIYLKQRIENENKNFITDMQLMQSDIKDILQKLQTDTLQNTETNQGIDVNILIEILLILREIATPTKLNSAQKKVNALGYKTINTLE